MLESGIAQLPERTGGSKVHAVAQSYVLFDALMKGIPFCETATSCPATVRKPERFDAVGFAAVEYFNVLGPTLFAPVSIVIQLFVLITAHEHKVGEVTVTCPVDVRNGCDRFVVESE